MSYQHVQSFISNVSFPTSLEEFEEYSPLFNMEDLLGVMPERDTGDLCSTIWTAPKWAKTGDIVFFFHAKTANTRISKLVTALDDHKNEYQEDEYWYLLNCLRRAKSIWDVYGGKIFAVGRIAGSTEYQKHDVKYLHWKSHIYAPINDIFVLENPVDISEFNSLIMLSRQSSITPVFGADYEYLKGLIIKKNKHIRSYLEGSIAQPIPLKDVTDDNWISVLNEYRRSFFLEKQFRTFYVDRLLRELGDTRIFYSECLCKTEGKPDSWVDNVIKLSGKYLMVESKLLVQNETDIYSQLNKYANADKVYIDGKTDIKNLLRKGIILVVDTESLYLYDATKNELTKFCKLDEIQNKQDIAKIKDTLMSFHK